jgi:hypothetical protein
MRWKRRAGLAVATMFAPSVFVSGCSLGRDFDKLQGGLGPDGSAVEAAPDAAADDASSDPDLVGWWKLDDATGTLALDSSSYSRNGRVEGGFTWTQGRRGGAISLDGTTGRISVDYNATYQALTIALWVYLLDDPTPALSPRFIGSGNVWEIKLNEGTPQFSTTSQAEHFGQARATLSARAWHHIAFTFQLGLPTPLGGFVDGVPVSDWMTYSFDATTSLGTSTAGLTIGSYFDRNYCHCEIDDVRLYRRAVSPSEIADLAR